LSDVHSIVNNVNEASVSHGSDGADHCDRAFDVIVVGGGVSGSACAAALSAGGADVLVVSSALDVIGLPGYGPVVDPHGGTGEMVRHTFERLPEGLRRAWLASAVVDANDRATMIVDRRVVSIETKRALEAMPGLRFRQALITDVRPIHMSAGQDPVVEVESAFGEVFRARAVILAPGLSLGGEIQVGDETLPGGRYGEVPATGLRAALARLGATFKEVAINVGARFGGVDILASADDRLLPVAWSGGEDATGPAGLWPADFPPAPHLLATRRPGIINTGGPGGDAAALTAGGPGRDASGRVGRPTTLWPDGIATAEYYLDPEDAVSAGADEPGPLPTRLEHTVRASVLMCIAREGKAAGGSVREVEQPVWVAGQAAGATGYSESLRSGLDVAELVLAYLRRDEGGE